jgi:hypothetical protein
MKANLGQNFIPLLDAFAQSVNEGAYVAQKQAAATGDVTRTNSGAINTYKGFSAETLKATNAIQEQWQEQEHLKDVMARVTQAAQDEAQAEKDDAAQIKAVTDAVKGQDGANLSLLQSEKAVLGDVTSLKTAHQHYLEVVKQYGPNSAAAKAALLDYNIALAQQKDDLDKVVIAAGAKAAADDIAKGKTDTAKDSAAAMVLELEDLEKTVKPGSALYKHYQDWIKLLQDTPVSIETTVGVQFNRAGGGAKAPKAFAAGGPSPVGEAFWVGEKGPELLTLDRPGWVTPHGAARPPAAGVALSAALYSGGAAAPPAWPAAAQAMAPTAAGSALESGADPTIARLLADIERNTEASAAAAREATAHLADISGAPRLSGTAAASRHG